MLLFILLMAANSGRSYTYLARATPTYFHGRKYYVVTFPDFSGSYLEADNLPQLQGFAKDALTRYIAHIRKNKKALPEPRYKRRNDLKRDRQIPITVSQEDLEAIIKEISAQKHK